MHQILLSKYFREELQQRAWGRGLSRQGPRGSHSVTIPWAPRSLKRFRRLVWFRDWRVYSSPDIGQPRPPGPWGGAEDGVALAHPPCFSVSRLRPTRLTARGVSPAHASSLRQLSISSALDPTRCKAQSEGCTSETGTPPSNTGP